MNLKRTGSRWDRNQRININDNWDVIEQWLNQLAERAQDLVAEGQLTPEQYAQLITLINGHLKSGEVGRGDLTPELRSEVDKVRNKIDKGDVSVHDIDTNKGKILPKHLSEEVLRLVTGDASVNATPQNLGVTNVKIEENAVSTEKADFIEKSTNLLNENAAITGYLIAPDGTESLNSSYSHSDFIIVEPNSRYYFNGILTVARYGENHQFIDRVTVEPSGGFSSMPSDCYYIIVNYQHGAAFSERRINKGSALPYEKWSRKLNKDVDVKALDRHVISNDNIEDNVIGAEKTNYMNKSTNLFNIDNVIHGYIGSADGGLTQNHGYNVSDFIPIYPNEEYSIYGLIYVNYYDENRRHITRGSNSYDHNVVTTPDDAHFIRVSYQSNHSSNTRRINKGRDLLDYEPYYIEFKKNAKLNSLNHIIENYKDRLMFDKDVSSTFTTNEIFDDYTDLSNLEYNEIYKKFDALMANNKNYITKEKLGDNSVGDPIYAYHLTPEKVKSDTSTKTPKIFMTCGVHGYEKASTISTYLTIKQMCEKWQEDDSLEVLRFNVEFIIIPVTNPYAWNINVRSNPNGVDIIRNFPYRWASGNPDGPNYGGTSPLSELEAQYINDILINNPDIDAFYDFHNFHSGSTNDEYFVWVPASNTYIEHMGQNLIGRLSRKWQQEFPFVPDDTYVGYTSINQTMESYAHEVVGIRYSSVLEICNRWTLDESGDNYDQNVLKGGVETLVNWLLITLREMSRY